MKVVLLQDIKANGKKGDLITVSDGYARNYLFPRALAKEANAQVMNELKNAESAKEHKVQMELDNARAAALAIDGKSVKLFAKAGQGGKLFGSVTAKEIAEQIKKTYKTDVDKRKIELEGDIKGFGTYTCEIKLHAGVIAKVYAVVEAAE